MATTRHAQGDRGHRRGEVRRVRRVRAVVRRGGHPDGERQGPAGRRRALRRPGGLPRRVSEGGHPRARAGGCALRRGGGARHLEGSPARRATPRRPPPAPAPRLHCRWCSRPPSPPRGAARASRSVDLGPPRAVPAGPDVRRPRASSPTGPSSSGSSRRRRPGWPAPTSCSPPTASRSPTPTSTATCSPGRRVLVGCPKLDDVQGYVGKLTEIFRSRPRPRSVTVARMEVPCCGGIVWAAREAVRLSGVELQVSEVTIGVAGQRLS